MLFFTVKMACSHKHCIDLLLIFEMPGYMFSIKWYTNCTTVAKLYFTFWFYLPWKFWKLYGCDIRRTFIIFSVDVFLHIFDYKYDCCIHAFNPSACVTFGISGSVCLKYPANKTVMHTFRFQCFFCTWMFYVLLKASSTLHVSLCTFITNYTFAI